MLVTTRTDPQDVDEALGWLGLTQKLLSDAATAGVLARLSCTLNDAPLFPPLSQWAVTLRVLRESLLPLGWSKSNEGNYCIVIDPSGENAIAVATGCPNTGVAVPGKLPTTKCPKGPSTVSALCINAELLVDLFPETVPEPKVIGNEQHLTWLLLFFVDEKELRVELSLPASMGHDGHVDAWSERIILSPVPLKPVEPDAEPDFGPEIEVAIKRRLS